MIIDSTDLAGPEDPGLRRPAVSVARGNIYLERETCDAYFASTVAVALIVRDDDVLIVPLTAESGGGLLLKVRNARGDRVIHAQEFFRQNDLVEDWDARVVVARWSEQWAAMLVSGIPRIAH